MNPRYAILLDGGFVTKRLQSRLKRPAAAEDVLAECRRIAKNANLEGHDLLRIYFYDAPPASGRLRNPVSGVLVNLNRTETADRMKELHDRIELSADVAFRRGEVAIHGWKLRSKTLAEIARVGRTLKPNDLVPNIQQKGVDLRIGLDIARLSLRGLVDTIVVVTGDSDMIPAFKFARREGVRVLLDHLGASVKRDVRAHADVVL